MKKQFHRHNEDILTSFHSPVDQSQECKQQKISDCPTLVFKDIWSSNTGLKYIVTWNNHTMRYLTLAAINPFAAMIAISEINWLCKGGLIQPLPK